MAERVKKRLHISGLTPNITAQDIVSRFESFGIVSDVTGFGILDANGGPRPFAFLTLETSKDKLARCLASLSGTTWKATRIRVGEARPDWKERIDKENVAIPQPAARMRVARGAVGVHAADMSLVTPITAKSRTAWQIHDGRLIRLMRMRPSRPLPPRSALQAIKQKKRSRKVPPNRARRKLINPTLYGSQHLLFAADTSVTPYYGDNATVDHTQTDSEESEAKAQVVTARGSRTLSPTTEIHEQGLKAEKEHSLRILQDLFSGQETWRGREEEDSTDDDSTRDKYNDFAIEGQVEDQPTASHQEPCNQSGEAGKKLEDIFSFNQGDGAFTLFDGNDPVEVDSDMEEFFQHISTPNLPVPVSAPIPGINQAARAINPDPKQPFFFPHQSDKYGREVIRLLEDRDSGQFVRSESSEDIRVRWEAQKIALTRDWKKRHRESVKLRRVRVGKVG